MMVKKNTMSLRIQGMSGQRAQEDDTVGWRVSDKDKLRDDFKFRLEVGLRCHNERDMEKGLAVACK